MAMADVLCHMKEKALNETNPHLMTIATLTGHQALAYGNYSTVMDVSGAAKKEMFAESLRETGEKFGDSFEISTVRKDDFDFITGKDKARGNFYLLHVFTVVSVVSSLLQVGETADVLQCNNAPSVKTPRGHQFPAAFLQIVSRVVHRTSTTVTGKG